MTHRVIPGESWESFDAEGLFPPPRLHANRLTRVDPKEMTKVDPSDLVGEASGDSTPEELGDTYSDAPVDAGHVDEMFKMEGLDPSSSADERELKADKEEDKRTQKSEKSDPSADAESEPSESGEDAPQEQAEPQKEDGTDQPIQKESEGVEEVAEATSKTSEDVHGGDEATKDIADSPNAADDGQNPDNHGAEAGEGGEQGDGEGSSAGDADGSNAEGETSSDPLASADWEAKADQSALSQRLYEQLAQVDHIRPASSAGGGAGVDYSGESWDNSSLRAIFFRTRELIEKLLSEEDFTRREAGGSRWWPKEVVKSAVTYRHPRIPASKFDRPKTNNIVFFMDVSGSVSSLAELFMSIMGGAAGLPGVQVVVGSEAHAENEIVVEKPFKTVDKAITFFRHSVNAHVCDDPYCPSCKGKIRHTGWTRPYEKQFEPGVVEYLRAHNLFDSTTTCVFFGDMQGVHFNTRELRKIVRACKCLWLFTDEPGHYTHTGDLPMAIEAGLPIVYNVRDARSFAKAVRRIQRIRPKMQLII